MNDPSGDRPRALRAEAEVFAFCGTGVSPVPTPARRRCHKWTGPNLLRSSLAREMHHHPAFTLVELLIVIVLLSIAAGLAIPTLGSEKQLRLREAARLVAADIEFTQSESIAHADVPRAIVFDLPHRKYWIAPRIMSTPGQAPAEATAVDDPVRKDPAQPALFARFVVTFPDQTNPTDRSDRASGLAGVTIQATQNLVADSGFNFLAFDPYGTPLNAAGQPSAATASITLAAGPSTLTIQVAPSTGEVSIP